MVYIMKKQNIKEIYELECPVCKKLIRSLNENQAHYNYKLHFESHSKNVGNKQ